MRIWQRLRTVWQRETIHDEIAAEMDFHRAMKAEELQQRHAHLTPAEANAVADQSFGKQLKWQERGFDERGAGLLDDVSQDLRFASRLLRKWPGQTALLLLTLALGIGVNTAVFSVVNAILLQPLPFAHAGELVILHQANQAQAAGVSYPNFLDWRSGSRSFDGLAIYNSTSAALTDAGDAVTIFGATVSADLFRILNVSPVRGRLFTADEDALGSGSPVLISDRLWRSRFSAREDLLGRTIRLDGKPFHVIGIMPARLAFPVQNDPVDYWTTVAVDADPQLYGGSIPTSRGYPRYDGVLARLKPGVTQAAAQAEMDVIARRLAQTYPKMTDMPGVRLLPAVEDVVGHARPLLLLLYGGVLCVLLAACANAASLLLVRSLARRREFSLRSALGANSGRLIRQLLMESLLVAVAAGLLGIGVAAGLTTLFVHIAPAETPRLANVSLDGWVLLYAAAVSLGAGLLFGLAPALHARRDDLHSGLKRRNSFFQGHALITTQVALSMVLTCAAAVLLGSFARLLAAPRGFDPAHVLTASLSLPVASYPQRSLRVTQFYDGLLDTLRHQPGVESVSLAQTLPLSGQNNGTTIKIAGLPSAEVQNAELRFVDPAYFATLRIPLLRGRALDDRDTAQRPQVIVVNDAFVTEFLGRQNPLQARVSLGWGGNGPKEIVGVVANVRHRSLSLRPRPEVYIPIAQFPQNDLQLLVRTTGDPYQAAAALTAAVRRADPGVPVDRVRALEEYALLSIAPQRFLTSVLVVFATSALLLSAIGLYGALAYSTTMRYREFGIRLALGSTNRGLMSLVLGQGLRMTAPGMVIGLVLAVGAAGLLARWVYEVSPTDPRSLGAATGVLLLVALISCWGPARRAAAVDPATSLRAE